MDRNQSFGPQGILTEMYTFGGVMYCTHIHVPMNPQRWKHPYTRNRDQHGAVNLLFCALGKPSPLLGAGGEGRAKSRVQGVSPGEDFGISWISPPWRRRAGSCRALRRRTDGWRWGATGRSLLAYPFASLCLKGSQGNTIVGCRLF